MDLVAELYDAGTVPVRPGVGAPGMDELYWREGRDWEEDALETRIDEQNRQMVASASGRVPMAPWPELMPGCAWVDSTSRHEHTGTDGLHLALYHAAAVPSTPALAPACDSRYTRTGSGSVTPDPADARLVRGLSWREIRDRQGPDWIRLDTRNEAGGTHLREPLMLRFRGIRGGEHRLVMHDNSLFAPFDLAHPERYLVVNDAGIQLPDEQAEHWMSMSGRGKYRLYFRPRRWRYLTTVVAHFLHITMFTTIQNDETFVRGHYDRPPFYEYRHDVLTTSQNPFLLGYYGGAYAYDIGVDDQWSKSRNAADLEREILNAQYRTPCEWYILMSVENAEIVLSRFPPRAGDYVVGIGRYDQATGRESRVWVQQRSDLEYLYPRTVIGRFIVPFAVELEMPF